MRPLGTPRCLGFPGMPPLFTGPRHGGCPPWGLWAAPARACRVAGRQQREPGSAPAGPHILKHQLTTSFLCHRKCLWELKGPLSSGLSQTLAHPLSHSKLFAFLMLSSITPAFAFSVPSPGNACPLSSKLLILHDPIPGSKTSTHSFANDLLITSYVPSTVLDAGDSIATITDKNPNPPGSLVESTCPCLYG